MSECTKIRLLTMGVSILFLRPCNTTKRDVVGTKDSMFAVSNFARILSSVLNKERITYQFFCCFSSIRAKFQYANSFVVFAYVHISNSPATVYIVDCQPLAFPCLVLHLVDEHNILNITKVVKKMCNSKYIRYINHVSQISIFEYFSLSLQVY